MKGNSPELAVWGEEVAYWGLPGMARDNENATVPLQCWHLLPGPPWASSYLQPVGLGPASQCVWLSHLQYMHKRIVATVKKRNVNFQATLGEKVPKSRGKGDEPMATVHGGCGFLRED